MVLLLLKSNKLLTLPHKKWQNIFSLILVSSVTNIAVLTVLLNGIE